MTSFTAFACGVVLAMGVGTAGPSEPDMNISTGDPACDDFLVKYEACIASKVMPAAKIDMAVAYVHLKVSLKAMADDPQSKPQLEMACKQSADAIKQQTIAIGCQW